MNEFWMRALGLRMAFLEGEGGGGGGGDQAAGGDKGGGDKGGGDKGGGDKGAAASTFSLAALPEDLRGSPHLKPYEGKSIADLARDHVNAQGLLGKKGVVVPGENATAQEIEQFWQSLGPLHGRPATAKDYGIQKPENLPAGATWDQGIADDFSAKAFEIGLSKRQAQALTEWNNSKAQAARDAQAKALATAKEALDAEIKGSWGGNEAANMAIAGRAATFFGFSEAEVTAIAAATGGMKTMDRFLKIGQALAEGGLKGDGDGGGFGGMTPEAARQKLDELNADKDWRASLLDAAHPKHKINTAEKSRLFQLAYPKKGG